MGQAKKAKRTKPFLLPLIAGIMVALALAVVVFIPKGGNTKASGSTAAEPDSEGKLNDCNGEMIIPAFDLSVKLHEGENVVAFTPVETGTIPYSCWMGMIKSSIYIVE